MNLNLHKYFKCNVRFLYHTYALLYAHAHIWIYVHIFEIYEFCIILLLVLRFNTPLTILCKFNHFIMPRFNFLSSRLVAYCHTSKFCIIFHSCHGFKLVFYSLTYLISADGEKCCTF